MAHRQGRKLEDVDAVSPVLTLKPDPREQRGLPQQEPVSEQVAHSPTLYFNTPNKEEEGECFASLRISKTVIPDFKCEAREMKCFMKKRTIEKHCACMKALFET